MEAINNGFLFLIIGIIFCLLLLYIFFPKGFIPKLGYSLLFTFMLSIIMLNFFKFYSVIKYKKIYALAGIFITFFSLISILYYLGFEKENRFEIIFNYISIVILGVLSYFIYNKMDYNIIVLISIIIISIVILLYNPKNILTANLRFGILLLIIFMLISLIASITGYNFLLNKTQLVNNDISNFKYLYILFGFIFLGLFTYSILGLFGEKYEEYDYVKVILSVLLVSSIIGIMYKILKVHIKNPLVSLILNSILFVPCLLINTPLNDYIFLLISITLLVVYYYGIPKSGKKLLKGEVVRLDKLTNITSDVIISDKHNYNYAISFWYMLDAYSSDIKNAYLNENNILKINDKIFIIYDPKSNTLKISQNTQEDVYIKEVLFQKWNNIILNYYSGTLDIFYNGNLVKSLVDYVPLMEISNLEIGKENGVSGLLRNLVYFEKPLNIVQIKSLYNS
jgi:hypothetical protein